MADRIKKNEKRSFPASPPPKYGQHSSSSDCSSTKKCRCGASFLSPTKTKTYSGPGSAASMASASQTQMNHSFAEHADEDQGVRELQLDDPVKRMLKKLKLGREHEIHTSVSKKTQSQLPGGAKGVTIHAKIFPNSRKILDNSPRSRNIQNADFYPKICKITTLRPL